MEIFRPISLLGREICDLTSVWIELTNVLTTRDARFPQNYSHHVINKLANGLYDESEDRKAYIETAQIIMPAGHPMRPDPQNTEPVPGVQQNSDTQSRCGGWYFTRLVHDICKRLKDSEKISRASSGSFG